MIGRARPAPLAVLVLAVAAATPSEPLAAQPPALAVPLLIQEALTDDPTQPDFQLLPGVASTSEPVTVGLPLPESAGICATSELGLSGAALGQFRVLHRWPGTSCAGVGRVQWVLVDTQASLAAGAQHTAFSLTNGSGDFGGAALASDLGATILVDTGAAQFTIRKAGFNLFDAVTVGGVPLVTAGTSPGLELVGNDATVYRSANDAGSSVAIEENGPARAVIVARGSLRSAGAQRNLDFTVRLHFYRGKTRARVISTLRNASELQQVNVPFQSLELVVRTSLTAPAFTFRRHDVQQAGTLGAADTATLFQGENVYPTFQDYDFTDFEGDGDVITTKWPTTISGYAVRRNAVTVASGTREQFINLLWGQASAGGNAVTFGTRFAAGWWPQGLGIDGNGSVRVGLFPRGNDKTYWARFTGHVTREVLFDFAAATPSGDALMTRFQYPLVAKAQDVDWYNTSGAFWEKLVSFDVERAFYVDRGWPTADYPDAWRPDLFIVRHFYWGTGGGRNQYDQAKVGLFNFLRQDAPWAGAYYIQAEEKLRYNADLAIYHSDDFDGGRADIPYFNDLPGIEWIPSAKAIFESEHLHAYALPIWYYLSGDERVREAYTDWGDYLHHFRPAGYNLYERGLIWNIFNLVDVYRFTGDVAHRDYARQLFQEEILDKTAVHMVSEGTDWRRGFYAAVADTFDVGGTNLPRADRELASFILGAQYPRAYAYIEEFLASSNLEADRARDVLEGMVRFIYREHWFEFAATLGDYGFPYRQSVDSVPGDPRPNGNWISGFKEIWPTFYWGHVLTGDPEFLRQAGLIQRLVQEPGITSEFQDWPDRQTLEHLQLHPEQHAVWQTLDLTVQPNGGGSYTLSWTVPDDARAYWIKYADRTIVPSLGFDRQTRLYTLDPAQNVPFFAASNVIDEPPPATPGTVQSHTVTGLAPGTSFSFAARVRVGPAATPGPGPIFADGFESGDTSAW